MNVLFQLWREHTNDKFLLGISTMEVLALLEAKITSYLKFSLLLYFHLFRTYLPLGRPLFILNLKLNVILLLFFFSK